VGARDRLGIHGEGDGELRHSAFSTLAVCRPKRTSLRWRLLQDYDLDICKNYKDIVDTDKQPAAGQLKNWFTPFVLIVMGLSTTPRRRAAGIVPRLLKPEIQGSDRHPAYGWVGNSWLQV